MSVHRQNFLATQRIIKDALQQPLAVDQGVGASAHNERSRLIRNGLAIMIFSSLEAFVRQRAIETLRNLNNAFIPFSALPDKLQHMLTFGAIKGIYQNTHRKKMLEAISLIQGESITLGSLNSTSAYGVSDFAFGQDKSNLSAKDISDFIEAVGIKSDVWAQVGLLCHRIYLGGLASWQEQFKQLADERHKAAHVSSHQVPTANLNNHLRNSFAIAAAFDTLTAGAIKKINAGHNVVATPLNHAAMRLVFVYPKSLPANTWGVKPEGANRATKVGADKNVIQQTAYSLAGQFGCVVELDASNSPVSWNI